MKLRAVRQNNQIIPSLILMVVALAFGLKAIIPAGFMPESRGGVMELVICSGMGEKTIVVPAEDIPKPGHQDEQKTDKVCAYHILTSGKILAPAAPALLPVQAQDQLSQAILRNSLALSFDAISFEARGPPSA